MRWLTKPGEPQRVLFSFENKDYEKCIKFQENLTKEGIPSLVSHKDSGDFQLEVWNNNKVFIKKLDSIAAKTNEEINCISSEIQSYSNRA